MCVYILVLYRILYIYIYCVSEFAPRICPKFSRSLIQAVVDILTLPACSVLLIIFFLFFFDSLSHSSPFFIFSFVSISTDILIFFHKFSLVLHSCSLPDMQHSTRTLSQFPSFLFFFFKYMNIFFCWFSIVLFIYFLYSQD